jgi:hypothetical protein
MIESQIRSRKNLNHRVPLEVHFDHARAAILRGSITRLTAHPGFKEITQARLRQ